MRVTECHPSYYYAPAPIAEALSDDAGLSLSDAWRLSVAYIGPKSRTERPRNTKIGTEVAHVTHDSDTTFNVKRSKINLQGTGAYCGGLLHSLLLCTYCITVHTRDYCYASAPIGRRH